MNDASSSLGLYFIAIIPPEPVLSDAQQWKEYFANTYQSKASLNSPPHITLHMPFKYKIRKEKLLTDALSALAQQSEPFDLAFDGFDSFPPRIVFLKILEDLTLAKLHNDVQQVMKRQFNIFNAAYRDRPFHAHLTLAFRDLKKDRFEEAWDEFKVKTYQGEFLVNQFWLLKHDGKRWHTFREFSLS